MGGQEVKVTNIKFINELTREIVLVIKEAEVENWSPLYDVDRGTWSIFSYSCEEVGDDLNGGQGI